MLFSKATLVASAVAAGLLLSAHSASAQTELNPLLPVKNTREIQLSGNLQFDPDNDVNLNLGYGYLLSRNLEVGGTFNYSNPDPGDSGFGIGAFADYHFPGESALLPFVGVGIGLRDPGGNSDNYFEYGIRGGVKYFLNQNVSANAILQYFDTDQANSKSSVALNLGLSVYLR